MENNLYTLSVQNNKWIEKNIDKGEPFYSKVESLSQEFSIPEYFAKHLIDNSIDTSEKFVNFTNPSIFFLHPPFLFKDMTKAISLIHEAKKNDYPVFIFGDSDVDGIMGIKIIYEALQKFGIKKIYYSIPENNEPYGISFNKIDIAISKGVKLIITVDNGISSLKEIEYAKSNGIKVIITDHHNPQNEIPASDAIINPKLENYQYPLCLAGSGVAWKLVEALIFSQTKIFYQKIFFINIDIVKFKNKYTEENLIFNFTIFEVYHLKIENKINFSFQSNLKNNEKIPNITNFSKTLTFSLGNIYNENDVKKILLNIISEKNNKNSIIVTNDIELLKYSFVILDINYDISFVKSFFKLIGENYNFLSVLQTYKSYYLDKFEFLYFMLYSSIRFNYAKCLEELERYLPYVSLATIADIMPVINENRYIISKGLEIINKTKPEFITNILSSLINVNYPLNSYDIIWKISPLLNSPGRFGKGELLLNYFLYKNEQDLLISLKEISDYNIKRSIMVEEIFNSTKLVSSDKPILIIEKEGVEPGLTGLLAAKYVGITSKPTIFITKTKYGIFGSMRSKNSFNSFQFLNQFCEFFENFGGHHFAAGFTIKNELYEKFINNINSAILNLPALEEIENILYYTCEITFDDLISPEFEKWYMALQPYGEDFKVPIFFSKNITLSNPTYIGRNNNSIKLKVYQDSISFDAIFFKNKQFFNDIKLNLVHSIIFEPYFSQNNLTLLIQDIFI